MGIIKFIKNFKMERAEGWDDTTIDDVRKQREVEHQSFLKQKKQIIITISLFVIGFAIMFFVVRWEFDLLNGMDVEPSYTDDSNEVPLANIDLDATKVEIGINEELKINVIYTPSNATDKNINWGSSNTDILTVNEDGVVIGLSEGEAIITARGSNGKKGTIRITVK